MTGKPVVFVCGLARCGTSLTMQMLHRAGIPCAGPWPAFEPPEINPLPGAAISSRWLRSNAGHAVKLLDPFRFSVDKTVRRLVIWLDRNEKEQAKSQVKFVHLLAGLPMADRAHRRRIEAALVRQRQQSLEKFNGWPRLFIRFEDLVKPDTKSPEAIAKFLAPEFGKLDIAAMAQTLMPRGPECQDGLNIELRLVREAKA